MRTSLPPLGQQISRYRPQAAAVVATVTLALGSALAPTAAAHAATAPSRPAVTRAVRTAPAHLAHLDPGLRTAGGASQPVVISVVPGMGSQARRAVTRSGGTPGAALPLVDGFAATVPADRLVALAAAASIRAVTADRPGQYASAAFDSGSTASNFVRTTQATAAWATGGYGRGVGVAVVDTGVSPVPDLAGRVVHGPDLSGEGSVVDTFGHGTVMAGLIAGDGTASAQRRGGAFLGVAPQSTVVAVKVAGRNGAADVSSMLEALHWVAAYRSQFNIRVLSLSWGVASTQDPSVDPIDYAVERLWREGIVVVVAAGNDGPGARTILKPGDDPAVLTVGAYDDRQDIDPTNDTVPHWAARGPTVQGVAKPDLVAPGRDIVGARSNGSAIEAGYPTALRGTGYIRGSGSSQATAITAGSAALLIGARRTLTPDQVKGLLVRSAAPIARTPRSAQGAGRLRLAAALTSPAGPPVSQPLVATGLGSLERSRGPQHVTALCGGVATVIRGEVDVRCETWKPARWTGSAWTGSAWTGSAWTGSAWTGSAWTGSAWTGSAWTGSAWTGSAWTGSAWTGSAWTGSAWTGSAWTGSAWTGSAWTGSAWTGARWSTSFQGGAWG